MQVQPITNNAFCGKNTFLQKAKYSLDTEDIKYFKSLHYEAKARLHYLKFKKASNDLAEIKTLNNGNAIKLIKTIFNVAKEKIISISNQTEAFHYYPDRFYEADDVMLIPNRFYKTNKL